MDLTMPFDRDSLKALRAGDIVMLKGRLYTARDAAHERISRAVSSGGVPPVDLRGQTIYYAGPCPAKPGFVCGSIGPTTSARMDSYMRLMFELGVSATIGKGQRSGEVVRLHKEFGGVYLMGVGGAAAIATSGIKGLEVVAYEDLGPESIKLLHVEGLKVIVGIDAHGDTLFDREIAKYRKYTLT